MDEAMFYSVSPDYLTRYGLNQTQEREKNNDGSFGSILNTAMNMINETNDYQNAAESAEIQFALGESESTHELAVAQQKANLALEYTVAVRDKVIEAYKEIMNMTV